MTRQYMLYKLVPVEEPVDLWLAYTPEVRVNMLMVYKRVDEPREMLISLSLPID